MRFEGNIYSSNIQPRISAFILAEGAVAFGETFLDWSVTPMCVQSQYSPLYHLACSVPSFWKGAKKLMAIYTGYFDESSDEEQPYLVMGGLILDAEKAADFDRDWRDAIRELPRLNDEPFLHTADFVSGNNQYAPEWKGRYEEKLFILSAAASVINRYSFQAITGVLHMQDYRELDSVIKVSETIGHPYTVGARIAYQHMLVWARRNSIASPIKMVLEARDGIGDVIEMFQINGYPIPSSEPKGLPALQAADYIAWVRLKRFQPNPSYLQVKDSWKQINKILYTDQGFTGSDLQATIGRAAEQHPDIVFPRRADDTTFVTYNGKFKSPRRPFKRPAPVVRNRQIIRKNPSANKPPESNQ